jgi:prepilin peptidase CpaA
MPAFIAYAFLAATFLLLCAAAWTDLESRIIPNVIPVAVFVVALVACIVLPELRADWAWRLASFAVMFVVGFAAFATRVLGGGDVKLLIALSPWIVLPKLANLLFFIGVAGGALACIFILVALARRQAAKTALRQRIPYGVAILAGAVAVAIMP